MVEIDDTPPLVADDGAAARSAALLQAVGFSLIPLAEPIAGTWDLLAMSPRGLTLVAARAEPPNLVGHAYGLPPGLPEGTRRLILTWSPDAALPTPLTL
jgi:hypothetical protein